jgi:DNA-binding transcriptional ArsR family regulator
MAAVNEPLDDALKALAEPRRRAILRLVSHQELSAGRIADEFEVTRSAVSQHIRVLKDAGLVIERREGTKRLYRARIEGLAELRTFVDQMWGESLDLARRLAEGELGLSDQESATG